MTYVYFHQFEQNRLVKTISSRFFHRFSAVFITEAAVSAKFLNCPCNDFHSFRWEFHSNWNVWLFFRWTETRQISSVLLLLRLKIWDAVLHAVSWIQLWKKKTTEECLSFFFQSANLSIVPFPHEYSERISIFDLRMRVKMFCCKIMLDCWLNDNDIIECYKTMNKTKPIRTIVLRTKWLD